MPQRDSEKERWRLAHHYGGMSEGELEKLAADAASLSDTAKRALKFEISRRGLSFALRAPALPQKPKFSKLVTIRQFRDVPEAYLAKGLLDSAGIESFLFDANIIWTQWLWSNALGGVKLRVREEDADEAAALLDEDHSISAQAE